MAQGSFQALDETRLAFYADEILDRSDLAYRFAAALVLDKKAAFGLTKQSLKKVVKDIEKVIAEDDSLIVVLKHVWSQYEKQPKSDAVGDLKLSGFEVLSLNERAIVSLVDIIGIKTDDAIDILGLDTKKAMDALVTGRQAILKA
jgi:hypothetical protein